ncbi:MAG: Txe/YoeB family addiction module toxin [Bacteroidales bacterium]|nr:Txe/YoeB family addiction module toxin [Bacteroidales bacterium]MBR2887149.1 Txe/YoeB family addiction module toxin [Bacteroidales bacterium]MBR6177076.1 Txe/YoeB family addiction module toxin [Bacteroidales bacterium]MDD6003494.1 Txe/YoeB family addiction module toxin [Bacteroidales bacterium]
MQYDISLTPKAQIGAIKLAKSEPKAYKKLNALIDELREHPLTGTGKPEPLKEDKRGRWSRRITDKHRLVYEIHGNEVLVIVISVYGHYEDK